MPSFYTHDLCGARMIKLWGAVTEPPRGSDVIQTRAPPNIAESEPVPPRRIPVLVLLDMPRAIISPSVLASDFGQLTAECKRMIKGGAEWLHMGMCLRYTFSVIDNDQS